jgi:hypothetical protein
VITGVGMDDSTGISTGGKLRLAELSDGGGEGRERHLTEKRFLPAPISSLLAGMKRESK